MNIWLLFLAMALGTFASRFSFILLFGRVEVPEQLKSALRFVPPAVLSAIVIPAVARLDGQLLISFANPRLMAAAVAAVVAWRTKSVLWTIAVGMVVLWGLQAALTLLSGY
ncbi:MAG: AzlD domain-containing protein [Chloroflexi bacterium]|nr:MAG: AzlD domain-containing protein [Chloroflexota bacterium]MBL1197308.1 AzlD domain-containing protein [Chloroflexota bacterium]NOH14604.1 AzlD domain-containing protein [Chloroflexota bacterium]